MIIMCDSKTIKQNYYDRFISLVNKYGRICKRIPLGFCDSQEAFDELDEWFIAFIHELGFKFESEAK